MKKFKFVRVSNYNNIYSVIIDDELISLFEEFLNKFQTKYPSEVTELVVIINQISVVGVREIQNQKKKFKEQSAPSVNRLVNNSQLKLYVIKKDGEYLLIGSGAFKRFRGNWQWNDNLRSVVTPLITIDKYIRKNKIDRISIEQAIRDKTTFIIK